ncbi:hypothetical protein [Lihuaxuella thermophila]|uniref:Glycosyl hydrolase-like 10 domain-containing protein n=1 Tax=Lihuaxuella thermophila TaxID=1173111 RepID=A0A1H8DE73_9BACL|nr:hypothetical protein [Lihuaxuella thermophila]SEN05590.1 hypothetical protein SAMN05444955_105136 [Lihuaxuella thermophila]
MKNKKWNTSFFAVCLCFILCWLSFLPPRASASAGSELFDEMPPVYGDYGGEIREEKPRPDGIRHVDTPRLIRRLKELKVNTYFFLIWHEFTDWDDLRKEFLPAAKQANIDVWVYLVPPSESHMKRSEPYGTDYISWFRAVGRLSAHYSNLKGIVIDDFNDNLKFFTPEYLGKARKAAEKENPQLQFYPQIYYPAVSRSFLDRYHSYIDGIVMTFRDDNNRNTQKLVRLTDQMNEVQSLLRSYRLPLILMIYASKLSATPANPSASYVEGALKIGINLLKLKQIQGLVTYVLYKEFTQEKEDRDAVSGLGYASFFAPPSKNLKHGDYVQLKQRVYFDPKGPYRLTFSHFSVYPLIKQQGRYVKQVLLDNRVIWEQSMTKDLQNQWQRVSIDLTPYIRGRKSAVLTFSLTRTKGEGPVWAYGGFDQLQAEGFQLLNPDFEQRQEWTAASNNPAMLTEVMVYDPSRRMKIYRAVRRYYTTFDLFQKITTHTRSSFLARKADHLVNTVLLGQTGEALETIKEIMTLLIFDHHMDTGTKRQLIEEGRQLYHLINQTEEQNQSPG